MYSRDSKLYPIFRNLKYAVDITHDGIRDDSSYDLTTILLTKKRFEFCCKYLWNEKLVPSMNSNHNFFLIKK